MLVWTIVVNDAEVGLSEVVDPGCDVVVEGVLEVDEGVLDVEEGGFDEVVEEGGFEVLVCCCELVEDTETGVEVDAMEEVAESVGVAVVAGLLLAIELDDDSTTEEVVGVEAAWEDVADVETPVSVLVELEDIVNCLNLRSLGRLLFIAKSAVTVPYSSSKSSC